MERNIALPVMMDVVKYPTARRQLRRGRYGGMMYRFTKQSADETIEVIAEVKKTECWLLTAYRL